MMLYVRLAFALACFGGVAWLAYDALSIYLTASGTRFTRFLVAFKGSITVAWARFSVVVGLIVAGLVQLAAFAQLPEVGQAIQAYCTPTTAALLVAVVAIVSEIARSRTL